MEKLLEGDERAREVKQKFDEAMAEGLERDEKRRKVREDKATGSGLSEDQRRQTLEETRRGDEANGGLPSGGSVPQRPQEQDAGADG